MSMESAIVCGGGRLFRVKRAAVVKGDNDGDFDVIIGWCVGDLWCTYRRGKGFILVRLVTTGGAVVKGLFGLEDKKNLEKYNW
ncbi:hypothetical protein Tco_1013811 [Tanacetum coccineum]